MAVGVALPSARLAAVPPHRRALPRACGETNAQGIPRCRSFMPTFMVAPRQRLRIRAASLALDELSVDVVLGDEVFNRLAQHLRHGHRFDEIGGGFGESFSLGGIGGDGRHRVGPGALRRAEYDPETRGTSRKILAVARGLCAVEIDRRAA